MNPPNPQHPQLPERQDFLDYAEGASQDAETQRRILNLLASSPVLREQLAELKRDLYLVSSQIPDYRPEATFGADLAQLAQNWIQLEYGRRFSVKNFYRAREFFGLMAVLVGGLLLVLAILGARLLMR